MASNGSTASKAYPAETAENLRTCIASGRQKPKFNMVRFVIGPDHRPVPDLEEKLPGRGLWLSAEHHVIHTACIKNLFAKRARQRVDIDTAMPDTVVRLLVQRCVRWLELARRAGQTVIGFDEVQRLLAENGSGHVLSAHDGGLDGRKKIARLAGVRSVLDALSATEMGSAFGRERVVHALVLADGLGKSLVRDMGRLAGLRDTGAAA